MAQVNLESFGGVQVVNPFETFAANLGVSLRNPEILQVEEWLTAAPGSACPTLIQPPRGHWVLVGFGRFGRAISKVLDREGIQWKAIDPAIEGDDARHLLHGDYAENMVQDAEIGGADALVAGADVDAVNLGVTTLARRIKPDIFVMIRQNHVQDRALVEAARADVAFVQSDLMVHECLQLLKTPTLGRFIARLRDAEPGIAAATLERVRTRSATARRARGRSNATSCSRECSRRSSRTAPWRSASPTSSPIRPTRRCACASRR